MAIPGASRESRDETKTGALASVHVEVYSEAEPKHVTDTGLIVLSGGKMKDGDPVNMMTINPRHAEVGVLYGPMFAGKTTELLRLSRTYDRLGLNTLLVMHEDDDRSNVERIVTHDACASPVSKPPLRVKSLREVVQHVQKRRERGGRRFDAVFIDEAQFMDTVLDDMWVLARTLGESGGNVWMACISTTFQGKPWPSLAGVPEACTYPIRLYSTCVRCGTSASFSHRKTKSVALCEVGGKESYEPLCASHFMDVLSVTYPTTRA